MADQTTPDLPAAILPAILPAAARRALAEAEARHLQTQPAATPIEHGGRSGPEPVRYGDWEKNGIAVDF